MSNKQDKELDIMLNDIGEKVFKKYKFKEVTGGEDEKNNPIIRIFFTAKKQIYLIRILKMAMYVIQIYRRDETQYTFLELDWPVKYNDLSDHLNIILNKYNCKLLPKDLTFLCSEWEHNKK